MSLYTIKIVLNDEHHGPDALLKRALINVSMLIGVEIVRSSCTTGEQSEEAKARAKLNACAACSLKTCRACEYEDKYEY